VHRRAAIHQVSVDIFGQQYVGPLYFLPIYLSYCILSRYSCIVSLLLSLLHLTQPPPHTHTTLSVVWNESRLIPIV